MTANASLGKLNDLLEGIRQEFAQLSHEANSYRLHQKDYDYKIKQQLAEMQQIRNTVYELEMSHRKMKDAYDEEIERLKIELDTRDRQLATLSAQQQQQQQQLHQQQLQASPTGQGHVQVDQNGAYQLYRPVQAATIETNGGLPAGGQSTLPQPYNAIAASQADHVQQRHRMAPAVGNLTSTPTVNSQHSTHPPTPALASSSKMQPTALATQPVTMPATQLPTFQQPQVETPQIKHEASQSATQITQTPTLQSATVAANTPKVQTPSVATPGIQATPSSANQVEVATAPTIAKSPANKQPAILNQTSPVNTAANAAPILSEKIKSPLQESQAPGTTVSEVTTSNADATQSPGQTSALDSNRPEINEKVDEKATQPVQETAGKKQDTADKSDESNNYLVPLEQRADHVKPIPPFLLDLDASSVPENMKKQTNDYYVLFNPALPRSIDLDLHKTLEHTSVVCCVKFSNDGEFLATGCNKTTQIYRVSDGELVARFSDENAHTDKADGNDNAEAETSAGATTDLYIRSVCFSPDGKFLATGAEDKLIRIWDIEQKKIVMVLKGHEQDIYSLDYFPSGDKLVSGSGDRTVRIWDLKTGQCTLTLSIEDGVTTVAVSPGDGKFIAAGSLDRAVRVWDSDTGFLVERLDSENELGTGHKDSVYSVVFTRDGNGVVSGSLDRSVKLWNLRNVNHNNADGKPTSGTCEVTYTGHKDFVLSVATTEDDEYILSGSKDRGVLFWDKVSGNPLLMLQGHRNSVISVAVNHGHPLGPNYHIFATGSGDCKARIWKYIKTTTEVNSNGKIQPIS